MSTTKEITASKNRRKIVKNSFPDTDSFRLALNSVKVGFWEWNMVTNEVSWSGNVASLFGLGPDSFEGTFEHYLKLIHSDDKARLLDSIQKTISTGEEYSVEHRILFSDGSIHWLRGEGKVHYSKDGCAEKMSGTVRDITQHKHSELLVHEREKLFTLLAESTRELFLNPDWHNALSRAFAQIGNSVKVDRMYLFKVDDHASGEDFTISQLIEWNSGFSEPQLMNPDLQKIDPKDFGPFFIKLFRNEPLAEIVKDLTHIGLRELLQAQVIQSILAFPIFVKTEFWGFVGFAQCTHERIWNEVELSVLQSFSATLAGSIEKHEAESEKDDWKTKHELVVKASGQIIYDFDIATGKIYWSGSVTEELGYSLDKMGDVQFWIDQIHPDDRSVSLAKLKDAEEALEKYDVFYRFRHKSGDYIHIHDKGFFLADQHSKAYRMLGVMMDVTDSIKKEIEKKEIELAYHTLFNNTQDAIIIAKAEAPFQIVSANISAAKMHGYELEEFSKLAVGDLKNPSVASLLNERLEGLLRGDRSQHESEHRRKDGSIFPVMIISGIINVRGQNYVMTFYQDISDAKSAKRKLLESLSLLTATLESTADGILVVDAEGKATTFNKKFLKLWNIHASLTSELDNDKIMTCMLDQLDDPDLFMTKVKYLYAHPKEKCEDVIRLKDGRVFHRYSKPQKIGDRVVGRVWSYRDITAQTQYERTLEESQSRFKRLQEASFGGISVHDNGIIIDANQGLANITGYSLEELIGMSSVQKLLAPEYLDIVLDKLQSGFEQPYDVEGIRKDGSRCYLEVQGKNIPYQGKSVRVAEFRDITERKKSEQLILQEKTRLQSLAQNLTRKNEQLEEFTQIVSHNLRSPIGNIRTLLDLHEQTTQESEKSEYLNLLKQTSISLLTTMQELNEVLKIKHNENIEKQNLKFADVFDHVLNMFKAKVIQCGATVIADFEEAPHVNYANIYLESIFLNLLSNALKYRNKKVPPRIVFTSYIEDGCILLKVSDNGIGINLVKYGHQVFKMRKTFHNHPDSRGIGLFMVKNQIESMGGEICVDSKENEGTVFTINFNKNLL